MSIARNSLYSISATLLPALVSIVLVPFYLSLIGAERYGALAIAWLLLGFFGQADFGMGRAVTRAVAEHRNGSSGERATIVWSGLLVVTVIGAVGAVAIYFAGHLFFSGPFKVDDGIRAELVASLLLLAASNFAMSLGGVAAGSLRGLERFGLVAIANMIAMIGMQVLPLLVAMTYSAQLPYLVAASLAARLAGLLVQGIGVWFLLLRGRPVAGSRSQVVRLAHFGKWIFVSSLVGPLMIVADRFLIGAVLGAIAVAAYTIPVQVIDRQKIFPLEVASVLFPRFAFETSEAAAARCRDFAVLVGQLFAPMVAALICLAGPLLSLWLGDQLDPRSIVVGQIVLAGAWCNALASVPYAYIQARGDSRYTALLHLAELPIYFVMLYLLGTRFGLAGIAMAYSLRCAVDAGILMARAGAWRRAVLAGLAIPTIAIIVALITAFTLQDRLLLLACAALLVTCILGGSWLQMPATVRQSLTSSRWARYFAGPVR